MSGHGGMKGVIFYIVMTGPAGQATPLVGAAARRRAQVFNLTRGGGQN